MSEETYSLTPFRFGYNNPVSYNDPTGLWEEIERGHKTKDKDEIERLFNFIKDKGNANIDQIDSFIKEDIAFTEELESGNSFLLSNVNLNFGENIKGGQLLRLKNEISFYQGKTDYLYNLEDFKKRGEIFSHRRGRFLQKQILQLEEIGKFQPLTSQNYVAYMGGRDVAHLRNYVATVDQMFDVLPVGGYNPKSIGSKYLGFNRYTTFKNSRASATSPNVASKGIVVHDISFKQFRSKFGHLFRGRFKGRGNYMKHMSLAWRKYKYGL